MIEKIKVCVDSNEASAGRTIVDQLSLAGCEIEVRNLPICDYVVSDRCGIERKSARDFFSSIKDGRLFIQAKEIANTYEKPILVLEGDINQESQRSLMNVNSIYGALASVSLDYGLSIIPTQDLNSTAVLIHRLAYREQTQENRPLQIRSMRRDMAPHEQQIFLLSGLPNIGPILAEELLLQLDTPYSVFEEIAKADIAKSKSGKTMRLNKPLREVKGVGPIIVEKAQRLLTGSFRENCEQGP